MVEAERKRREERQQIPYTRAQQKEILGDAHCSRIQQKQVYGMCSASSAAQQKSLEYISRTRVQQQERPRDLLDSVYSETKGIQKALGASYWESRGTDTLILVMHFHAAQEKGYDYATPCYAIYANKPLRKKKIIISVSNTVSHADSGELSTIIETIA